MSDETVYKAQTKGVRGDLPLAAIGLIAAGLLFLFFNLTNFELIDFLWPGFILGPGLLMLWPSYRSTAENRSSLAFLAVPGAFFVGVGAMLFIMNLSDHYEAWAYAWTLLPAFLVGGAMYMKRFDEDSRIHESGHRVLRALVLSFMALAVLFELFIFSGLGHWWPVLLIGLGFYLLMEQRKK